MKKHSIPSYPLDENCPLRQMFALFGDRWTSTVLYVISDGVKRYSELQKQIPEVTKKMLTQTLRMLEQDGLVKRTVYAVVPPKTEYSLTPLGLRFLEPITALAEWSHLHQKDLGPIFLRRLATACMVMEPSTDYYQIMTKSGMMPRLVGEVI